MTPQALIPRTSWPLVAALAFVAFAVLPSLRADAGGPADARRFNSPEEAVKALVAATKAGDHSAVDAIFGPGVKGLLSGDPRQDALEFAAFATSVGRLSHLVRQTDDRYVLDIGAQNWPMSRT